MHQQLAARSNHLFIIAQMVYRDKKRRMCGEQVSFFLGDKFLITVKEEADYDVFNPVRARLRSERGSIRKSNADYLAYALLDSIIDHYHPILEELGDAIKELEDDLLERPSREKVLTLHEYKRESPRLPRP